MSWGLFSDRLFVLSNKNTPEAIGPGKYDVEPVLKTFKTMKVPFNSGSSFPRANTTRVPGPGSYNTENRSSSAVNTSVMNSKTERKCFTEFVPNNPSPTEYCHLNDWTPEPHAIPKVKLPTQRAYSGFVGQKGVAGYALVDGDGEVSLDTSTSRREMPANPETPHYMIGKHYVMKPITKAATDETYIGPGTYDPEIPEMSKPPVSMEMSAKRDLYGKIPDFPGPGAYSPDKTDTRIPTVIRDKPKQKVKMTNRPIYTGPRVWTSLANETNACFKTKGTRHIFPPGDPTPDPTSYNPEFPKSKKHGDMSGFGTKAKRPPLHTIDTNPGPGAYNVKGPKWIKKGNAGPRAITQFDPVLPSAYVPGPGAYDPLEQETKRPDYRPNSVFTSKSSRDTSAETLPPGPGRYSPHLDPYLKEDPKKKKLWFSDVKKSEPPQITESRFPKFRNIFEFDKSNPSPDSYQKIECDLSKGRTIPTSPRFEITHKNRDPGPGAYEVVHKTMLRHSYNSSIPNYA